MDKLLKEAIADAKAVRETALANAKIALEEAFTPHLKSMLSRKLQAEMDGEGEVETDEQYSDEDEEMTEEMDSSEIGAADNKEPDAAAAEADAQGPEEEGAPVQAGMEDEEAEETEQPMGENQEMGTEDEDAEMAPEQPMGEQEEPGIEAEDEYMSDEDDDLAEVLRQLEAEMADEEDEMPAEEPAMEPEAPAEEPAAAEAPAEEPAMAADEEEIDLDEIIKALSEEGGIEDENEEPVAEQEAQDEDDPVAELEEYKQTVAYLKDKLSEVNLLNAKLLYTNKLFRSRNVSETQKMKVIEQFDRAANVREVKLVYTTFAESMKRKPVNESARRKSQASKPMTSTQSKKPIIGEQVDFKTRMKKLANII